MSGQCYEVEGRYFLVSAPLTEMIEMMSPSRPPRVLSACRALRYRNHVGVNLVVEGTSVSGQLDLRPLERSGHGAHCKLREFLSRAMSARPGHKSADGRIFLLSRRRCLGRARRMHLIERAKRELAHMKILQPDQVLSGFVVRSDKAYPVIEIGYERHIATIKRWLDQFQNLLPIGRIGMFKYNNQDHAMATGLLAARTALGVRDMIPGSSISMLNITKLRPRCAAAAPPRRVIELAPSYGNPRG